MRRPSVLKARHRAPGFREDAPPARQTDGAAGYDLHAAAEACIEPGARAVIPAGYAVQIPRGWVGLVCPRSGLAARHGVTVLNAPGIIDSDYRGEVAVILVNLGDAPYHVCHGDRVAQLVLVPCATPEVQLVHRLTETRRADAGFGSTGV